MRFSCDINQHKISEVSKGVTICTCRKTTTLVHLWLQVNELHNHKHNSISNVSISDNHPQPSDADLGMGEDMQSC